MGDNLTSAVVFTDFQSEEKNHCFCSKIFGKQFSVQEFPKKLEISARMRSGAILKELTNWYPVRVERFLSTLLISLYICLCIYPMH